MRYSAASKRLHATLHQSRTLWGQIKIYLGTSASSVALWLTKKRQVLGALTVFTLTPSAQPMHAVLAAVNGSRSLRALKLVGDPPLGSPPIQISSLDLPRLEELTVVVDQDGGLACEQLSRLSHLTLLNATAAAGGAGLVEGGLPPQLRRACLRRVQLVHVGPALATAPHLEELEIENSEGAAEVLGGEFAPHAPQLRRL
jgi:hypothetical protein